MGSAHTGVCVQKEPFANATHSHKIYILGEREGKREHTHKGSCALMLLFFTWVCARRTHWRCFQPTNNKSHMTATLLPGLFETTHFKD